VIAALPDSVTSPADTSPPEGDIARNIQLELIRLGCLSGNADGKWGSASRAAVGRFNRYAKATLNSDEPSSDTMNALRENSDRVCPLVCEPGFRAQDDVCVAVEPSHRPSRKADRPSERPSERQRSQGSTPRRESAATSKPPFISPLCQSRFQQGGKWCCTYDPEHGHPVIICR
jgi:hypothetical protein